MAKRSNLYQMSKVASSIMAESWPWDSKIVVKKMFCLVYLKKLDLKSESTHQFKLYIFGTSSTVENLDYAKVKTASLSSTESIFLKCYVKSICKPIPNHSINIAKNSYPHLQHLNLANQNDDRDLSVSILIGSVCY